MNRTWISKRETGLDKRTEVVEDVSGRIVCHWMC